MALKLKLKVNPSSSRSDSPTKDQPALPRIKIKPPKAEPSDGVSKPKKKEKLKKLKISLGKALLASHVSETSATSAPSQPILKKVPKVRIKPTRIPGEGYDSEAPDVEDDPLIEQGIVVRFANDVNLDFIHNAADTGDFSNVNIKWITRDKAVVNVNLTLYSARLIDLPTLTEIYKTIDKKNIFKTIDISQILLVLHQINPKQLNMDQDFEVPEEYTYVHPLYKLSVNNEIRNSKTVYRNGLAYAYEDVYQRFRPRKTNPRVMADIELRVDELVRRDQDAQESHYEYVDSRAPTHKYGTSRSHTPASLSATPRPRTDDGDRMATDREEEEDEDEQEMTLDIEADIDNVLEQELAEALDSTSNTAAATVLMKAEFENEDGGSDVGDEEEQAEEDDDEEEEEEDEDDDDDDEDEDTKQDKSRVKKLEEEISDLERAADKQKVLLATASFKMMRMKFQSAYNSLKAQIDLKKRELAKIREQQQKLQMGAAPVAKNEDEDEEDEEEDEVDEENDQDEDAGRPQQEVLAEAGANVTDSGEIDNGNHGDDEDEDDENDDIDDFGDLF